MTKFLNISTDNTLGGVSPSDETVSSQKAIKDYIDGYAISDVTVNGVSVVSGGVAVIPNASGDTYGVTKLSNSLVSTSNTTALTPGGLNTFAREIVTGAPIFDKTQAYAVGDKVRYSSGYYECNTAITTGHAWNANEWTQITIQGQIDDKVDDVTVSGTSIVSSGVAVIPIAQMSGDYGLVKLSSDSTGIMLSNSGTLQTRRATDADIAAKTQINRPIVPANLDLAVKIGVTTNTITLSSAEQTDACTWLGASQGVIKRVWTST